MHRQLTVHSGPVLLHLLRGVSTPAVIAQAAVTAPLLVVACAHRHPGAAVQSTLPARTTVAAIVTTIVVIAIALEAQTIATATMTATVNMTVIMTVTVK